LTVSWSVVIISVRLGTAAGLSMVLRTVMRRREVMVMVVIKIIVVVVLKVMVVVIMKVMLVVRVKVMVVGQRRAKRVK